MGGYILPALIHIGCKTASPWREIKNTAKNAGKKFTAEEINNIALIIAGPKTSTTGILTSAISCGVSIVRYAKTEAFCQILIPKAKQKPTK